MNSQTQIDLLLTRIEIIEARLDKADRAREKTYSMLSAYLDAAVAGGIVPAAVANEFRKNLSKAEIDD